MVEKAGGGAAALLNPYVIDLIIKYKYTCVYPTSELSVDVLVSSAAIIMSLQLTLVVGVQYFVRNSLTWDHQTDFEIISSVEGTDPEETRRNWIPTSQAKPPS